MDLDRLGVHESVGIVFPPDALVSQLDDLGVPVEVVGTEDVSRVDAVVSFLHREQFTGAVSWVHSIQAGYDRFPLDEYREAGVTFTNSSGIHEASVGETTVGLMLSLARRLHAARDAQGRNEWDRPAWDAPFTLYDEPITVVGLGTLGRGIANRADGLGMRVSGVRRTPARPPNVRRVYPPRDLHEAIADARFVALACPLTEDTRGLVGPAEFGVMREDAYLVNVARGPVVQEDALVDAVTDGEIAGAALDVYDREPLPGDSPLWDLDDVVLTPHTAGASRDLPRDVAALVRENVRRARDGDALVNVVT